MKYFINDMEASKQDFDKTLACMDCYVSYDNEEMRYTAPEFAHAKELVSEALDGLQRADDYLTVLTNSEPNNHALANYSRKLYNAIDIIKKELMEQ